MTTRTTHNTHKPEYEKPEKNPDKDCEKDEPKMPEKAPEKGCGGNCRGDLNSNFAPINSNVQNFVNVDTDINTNINMNMGSFGQKMEDWESELISMEDIVQVICGKLGISPEDFGDLMGILLPWQQARCFKYIQRTTRSSRLYKGF